MPRTTLTIEGLPEGDEANTVTVKYTKPVTDSSAWLTDTFTVVDEYVDAGTEPIVSTALDLPGVYRMSEASNKAILKLRRSNNRQRISFVTVDEGIMFQPADVLEINDTNRGITGLQVYVETAVMIDYGRWRITGIRYRDADYSDECYLEEDNYGKWVDVLGPPVVYVDCLEYDCQAYATQISSQGFDISAELQAGTVSPAFPYPFATTAGERATKFTYFFFFISSPSQLTNWSGGGATTTGNGVRRSDLSNYSAQEPQYCTPATLCTMIQSSNTGEQLCIPTDLSAHSDYTFSMVISTYNGGASADIELCRNPGKYWTVTGGASGNPHFNPVYINITTVSPGHQISITVGDGSPGLVTDTLSIGNLQNTWAVVSANVTNADPVIVTGTPDVMYFETTVDLKITRYDTGVTQSLTVTGSSIQGAAGGVDATGAVERTHTLYTRPGFFYTSGSNKRIALQYLNYDNSGTADLTGIATAFLQNFDDFVDPNCA